MPFKRLMGKRSGRYDLSRDLYVIAVQLLDGHILQCTLSTDSTGKDCMDYICQRLELQQNIFFGLRHKCARMVCRWVELDKPLRKQLEKTTPEMKLYFGVMFHAPNAASLTDPVARYCYFLQMRADVLDGRLLVSAEKAISLASYSLQIDFGDHEETKPTVATLRGTPLLPRNMTQSSQVLEDLIKQVIVGYKSLRGLSRAQAETLYITEAQQCDGYGEEYFSGKDEDGSDIFIGYCMEGIIVKRLQGPPVKYKWEEIVSILANRRNFVVNCTELAHAHFQMEDVETAKYAAYVCGLHLQFFRYFFKREDGAASISRSTSVSSNAAFPHINFLPQEHLERQNVHTPAVLPFPGIAESSQHTLTLMESNSDQLYNGFVSDLGFANQQLCLGAIGGHRFIPPPSSLQGPYSYSTTSVDQLSTAACRLENQREALLPHPVRDIVSSQAPVPSINSPFSPSVSSLTSTAAIYPLQQPQPQQRVFPKRLPHWQQDSLQSWMSQQVLAASTSTLSLNRTNLNAFNGSVPHIHAVGGPNQPPVLNRPTRVPTTMANQTHLRLFNGPGRPLSLDEFNLNEMLRNAYEFQHLPHQQPISPNPRQLLRQRQFVPANSEQSSPFSTDSGVSANGRNAAANFRPPLPHAQGRLPSAVPTTHPGMQYIARLEAYLHSKGSELLLHRIPQSPPMLHARLNGSKLDEAQPDCSQRIKSSMINLPTDVAAPSAFNISDRPGTAISRPVINYGIPGNDKHFVSTPDLTSMALLKSQSSPSLIPKQMRHQQEKQQQHRAIDTRTFDNLSVENLDAPSFQQNQQIPSLNRDNGMQSMEAIQDNEKGKQNGWAQCVSHSVGSPQRIIVGTAASSSGESDEHLEDLANAAGQDPVVASRDTSRSTIMTSSTSTLPDDPQAFQRFNAKLYEQRLMMLQREQQLQYQQQVRKEQECAIDKPQSSQGSEHYGSVTALNSLAPKIDVSLAKERRKSAGELLGSEMDVSQSTAHRHRLLVNDHGGSSSEEALKTPYLTADEPHDYVSLPDQTVANTSTPEECNGEQCAQTQVGKWTEQRSALVDCGITSLSSKDHIVNPDLRQGFNNGAVNHDSIPDSLAPNLSDLIALEREYELIPKKRASAGLSTAQRPENQSRNRDMQILPYEDTRVTIRPSKHNPHGYINASYIQVPVGTTMLKYIATQGPLHNTLIDFWQMIWESGSRIIVMLTKCVEQSQEQSSRYWPSKATVGVRHKLNGEYHISLQNCTESKTHVTSTLMLKHNGTGQKRFIYHLQYLDWPEGGLPCVDSFLGFIDEVNSVKVLVANELIKVASSLPGNGTTNRAASRGNLLDGSISSGSQSSTGNNSGRKRSLNSQTSQALTPKGSIAFDVFGNGVNGHNQMSQPQQTVGCGMDQNASDAQLPPVTVHCNFGAGRTGVYLLAEVMINALQHNQDFDMVRALTLLRQKRMLLVQTFQQYRFVNMCIAQFARKSRLI